MMCVATFASTHCKAWSLLLLLAGPQPMCVAAAQAFVEFEGAEEAMRAVAQLDRQPLLPEASKRFVRLEQVSAEAE